MGRGFGGLLRFLKIIIFEIDLELSLVFCANWVFCKGLSIWKLTFWDDGKVPGRCYVDILIYIIYINIKILLTDDFHVFFFLNIVFCTPKLFSDFP